MSEIEDEQVSTEMAFSPLSTISLGDETSPLGRRVERAVKSTAALVAEARELLEVRQAKLREERELAVLRAAFRAHCGKGEAKPRPLGQPLV